MVRAPPAWRPPPACTRACVTLPAAVHATVAVPVPRGLHFLKAKQKRGSAPSPALRCAARQWPNASRCSRARESAVQKPWRPAVGPRLAWRRWSRRPAPASIACASMAPACCSVPVMAAAWSATASPSTIPLQPAWSAPLIFVRQPCPHAMSCPPAAARTRTRTPARTHTTPTSHTRGDRTGRAAGARAAGPAARARRRSAARRLCGVSAAPRAAHSCRAQRG